MKPDKGTIKSQSSSRGRKRTRPKLDHGLSEGEEELSTLTKETVIQKRPQRKTRKKVSKEASEVIVRKLKQNKSEPKSSRNARDRLPLALESLQANAGVIKIETTSKNAEGAKRENIKKTSLRKKVDKNVKKRKIEEDRVKIRVEAKRKTVKKYAAKTDIIIEKQEEVDLTDGNGMTHTRKRAKRILKQKESLETETEPDIPAKRKRKRSLFADAATKTQKLNTEKSGKKARGKSLKKEGVAEEVNSDTKDKMAKQVATKAVKFVGAHMSIAGGLENAVKGAVATGAKAFALFLRSQRQWAAKPLEDKSAEKFRQACHEHNFSPHVILPHGSYLMNCGSPNAETLRKSRETLADELNRCEKLGLTRYNFHPGSTCGEITVEECLDKIGDSINIVHQQTKTVMTVIENMSRQGNTVGGRFEELQGIIERVKDKSRIGVCLDTCHAFAAGFDLSSESGYQDMMTDFDRIVGLKYLVAVHLNDSKGKVGSHLDRHEKIGKGQIGIKAFKRLMNDPRFDEIPLILETPVEDGLDYAKEIKLLYSLIGKS